MALFICALAVCDIGSGGEGSRRAAGSSPFSGRVLEQDARPQVAPDGLVGALRPRSACERVNERHAL